MSEHEDNLRDLAAMFAMMGLLAADRRLPADIREIPEHAYQLANEFMVVREIEAEDREAEGIASIKRKRSTK
jgi:hypothetical protein